MTLHIDPLLSLAVTLHANKGCYALLLGSGVSRGAGIGSAWEIICDLIGRLARLTEEDCHPDPAAWFHRKFGAEPTYDALLEQLAQSAAERRNLLRSYFEPTAEEREEGKKQPTNAHRAIAMLVQKGFVRVILTTNFDQLLEQALQAEGVQPHVIASADAMLGALPLPHPPCLLVKLHGDYLDTRIKNAPHELESYDPPMDRLLDRVLDEYGLIVCGWSADWDVALRAALERCNTHRFTTYWVSRGDPTPTAAKIITLRKAVVVRTPGADEFFGTLAEHVQSIEESFAHDPLSKKVAIATLKRYLAEDRHRIKLHDFVRDYTERSLAALSDPEFLKVTTAKTFDAVRSRLREFEGRLGDLLALIVTGCFWAQPSNYNVWKECLERITTLADIFVPIVGHPDFRAVPACLLMYGGGMAAMAGGRYDLLTQLLQLAVNVKGNNFIAAQWLRADYALEQGDVELAGTENSCTPTSDYVFRKLWHDFREVQPDEEKYARLFDRFECLLSVVALDASTQSQAHLDSAYIGRFGLTWRRDAKLNVVQQLKAEQQAAGAGWPPFQGGLVDPQRFQALLGTVEARMHEKMRVWS